MVVYGLHCNRKHRNVLNFCKLLSPGCNLRGEMHIFEKLFVQRITVQYQKKWQQKVLSMQNRLERVLTFELMWNTIY